MRQLGFADSNISPTAENTEVPPICTCCAYDSTAVEAWPMASAAYDLHQQNAFVPF